MSQNVQLVLLFLGVTIISGVLHRIFFYFADGRFLKLSLNLYASLLGTVKGLQADDVVVHVELQDDWDRRKIISRIKTNYDLDYELLEKYNVSLGECREIYQDIYSGMMRHETKALEQLNSMLNAFAGRTEDSPAVVKLERQEGFEEIRKGARIHNRIRRVVGICYYACTGSFIIAIVILLTDYLRRT